MNLTTRLIGLALCAWHATTLAGVTPDEAARLGKDLTPFGAERAGNKAGTIPAWTPGTTTPAARINGRRPDPFASDKPLYAVTSKNAAQYSAVLSDGEKAMFAKYDDYRMDVYPTRRTATAPAFVTESTRKNATRAQLEGDTIVGAFGGIPFPIPKNGAEAIWNSVLFWGGANYRWDVTGYLVTADGRPVLTIDAKGDVRHPYYDEALSLEEFEKAGAIHSQFKIVNSGPPVRAGEAFLTNKNMDPTKDDAWVYLTGQRRVRKLPNACCDTPAPQTAGIMTFDEQLVFSGRLDRMDWRLVGKQEMLIPYNDNRLAVPASDADVLGKNFLNPDHVRWELHRVWVVESTVRAGQRHQSPRSRYYLDEDTWLAVLADRWDQKGQLWKMLIQYPFVAPDLPGVISMSFGMHDFNSGVWFINGLMNAKPTQLQILPGFSSTNFQPEALAAQSIR